MDIEATLNNTIFFPSIKNGTFDYGTPMKSILTKFDIDKTTEPSQSLFEYLCYKIVKKKALEGTLNTETVLITEKFLTSFNCKKVFIKTKAIQKKHIIIFLQNKNTLKWSLIAFLNLAEQLKNCFDENKKQPITAKIISSNANSDEDDVVLNSTMDKLENTFDFKSPNDIQFELDSINISDQPNTSIFLLNFIEGLIVQNDENISLYIKKLYDEGSNSVDLNSKAYFSSFNKISEDFENIYIKYQNELNEYFKKNKYNILNFDAEKIMNGNKEFFVIENNKDNIENGEKKVLIEEKGLTEENKFVNGMENKYSNLNIIKDEIDMIQLEQDDDLDGDLNSDEEEEALKIMERENEEAKSIRDQERKLRQRIYKQRLRFKNMNMYKEFGIIKEEDNESESESIDLFNKLKEEKGKNLNESLKLTLKKTLEEKKNKITKQNNNNANINIINNINIDNKNISIKSSSENNKNISLNTDNNIISSNKNTEKIIKIENKNTKTNQNTDKEKTSKSEKSIKLSVLKDLEEAIEEIELEQDPIKNNKDLNNNANNKKKSEIKISLTNENRPIEKKNSLKNENRKEDSINTNNNKKEKKYINVFKENIDIKKRNSFSKSKEKDLNIEDKRFQIKINEKLKKTLTNIKKNEKDKEKPKEKSAEEGMIKYLKTNSLQKKILLKDISIRNNKNNKSNNSNSSNFSNKPKDQDNNSNSNSNNTTKIYNTNSYNSNSSRSNNEREKSPNIKEKENNMNEKELNENIAKKNNNNNNSKNNKSSKNKTKQMIKKTNSKKFNEKQAQSPLISKLSNISQKSSSTNKTGDSFSKSSEDKNTIKNKKKAIKEIEIKLDKNKNNEFLAIDNPLNSLPPQKTVERNGYFDLNDKDKDKIENGSINTSVKISINNNDINSVKSDRNNGDYSSNINIENIFSDDFESEKDKFEKFEIKDEGSFLGENRTKKISMIRKVDKRINKKRPPGKPQTSRRDFNDYCNYDEEGANKICGCIGEQSNGICTIF